VVGSVVAAQSGLKVGDEIQPTHGIGSEGHKHEGFKVVGILQPTGTANDRGVFINIEGFYLLEGHASAPHEEDEHPSEQPQQVSTESEHEAEAEVQGDHKQNSKHGDYDEPSRAYAPLPIDQRKVTSILVLCNSPFGPTVLDAAINKADDPIAQVVPPAREIRMLLDRIIDPLRIVLLVLTILIFWSAFTTP
jgi:putative ABC transport system permease protein